MDWRPGRLLRLSWVLDAPPARIFRMMTEPSELVKWWGPRGFTTPDVQIDLEVGGAYRLSMQPPDGDLFHLSGEFQEIDPPGRLVYTFRWDEPTPDDLPTVVTILLVARGDATEVSLTQGMFATDERLSLHRDGWTESFEKLRDVLRQAPRPR
jgi:uncharacterized protein YndB with AHSA1/START domain